MQNPHSQPGGNDFLPFELEEIDIHDQTHQELADMQKEIETPQKDITVLIEGKEINLKVDTNGRPEIIDFLKSGNSQRIMEQGTNNFYLKYAVDNVSIPGNFNLHLSADETGVWSAEECNYTNEDFETKYIQVGDNHMPLDFDGSPKGIFDFYKNSGTDKYLEIDPKKVLINTRTNVSGYNVEFSSDENGKWTATEVDIPLNEKNISSTEETPTEDFTAEEIWSELPGNPEVEEAFKKITDQPIEDVREKYIKENVDKKTDVVEDLDPTKEIDPVVEDMPLTEDLEESKPLQPVVVETAKDIKKEPKKGLNGKLLSPSLLKYQQNGIKLITKIKNAGKLGNYGIREIDGLTTPGGDITKGGLDAIVKLQEFLGTRVGGNKESFKSFDKNREWQHDGVFGPATEKAWNTWLKKSGDKIEAKTTPKLSPSLQRYQQNGINLITKIKEAGKLGNYGIREIDGLTTPGGDISKGGLDAIVQIQEFLGTRVGGNKESFKSFDKNRGWQHDGIFGPATEKAWNTWLKKSGDTFEPMKEKNNMPLISTTAKINETKIDKTYVATRHYPDLNLDKS